MIGQIEADINGYLRRRQVDWPRRCKPADHGPGNGEHLGCARQVTAVAVLRVRRSHSAARVVEVRANEHGYLDNARVQELQSVLIGLAGPGQRGHVVIDLSHVRSLNTQFLRVVGSAQERLKDQRRRVALCGLQPRCADVLRANGLNPVVECYSTQQQALATLGVR
jgi:anti-anti-sigma factor